MTESSKDTEIILIRKVKLFTPREKGIGPQNRNYSCLLKTNYTFGHYSPNIRKYAAAYKSQWWLLKGQYE